MYASQARHDSSSSPLASLGTIPSLARQHSRIQSSFPDSHEMLDQLDKECLPLVERHKLSSDLPEQLLTQIEHGVAPTTKPTLTCVNPGCEWVVLKATR